jgi:hypothetical protein
VDRFFVGRGADGSERTAGSEWGSPVRPYRHSHKSIRDSRTRYGLEQHRWRWALRWLQCLHLLLTMMKTSEV